jgi:uncharacterized cupredoxin-like copper-binding protein
VKNAWICGALFVALVSLMAACGADGYATSSKQNTIGHSGKQQVQITLVDYKITSNVMEFKPGVGYHFVVKNNGKVKHEFMIMPKSFGAMDNMSMSDMDKMALTQVEDIEPGQTKTVDYTFGASTAGSHPELGCFYPGHYQAGMRLEVKVA